MPTQVQKQSRLTRQVNNLYEVPTKPPVLPPCIYVRGDDTESPIIQ